MIPSTYPFKRACNYHCNICKKTGRVPNMAGRFYTVGENQYQCSGCMVVFERDSVSKSKN